MEESQTPDIDGEDEESAEEHHTSLDKLKPISSRPDEDEIEDEEEEEEADIEDQENRRFFPEQIKNST